jgi:2-dehydro-3-deoxygalactonokinase
LTAVEQSTSANVRIIPGICIEREDNVNVMRGEETQLAGAYVTHPAEFYLLPGTHSKWVRLEGDSVMDFSTVMTGELHYLLLNHSLVGSGLPEQIADNTAFTQGMEQGFYDTSLLRRLFEVRAARVLGKLAKTSVSDWLSGLLIGHEVAQMQQHYSLGRDNAPLILVGSPTLTQRYLPALNMAGLKAQVIEGDVAFQAGIRSIVNALEN